MPSRLLLHLLILTCAATQAVAQLAPAAPFGNQMVLQRDMPCAIYGTATAGVTVTATLRTAANTTFRSGSAVADGSGAWRLHFDAAPAGGPYSLVITDGTTTVTYTDVHLGEVWLMSGQSNMAGAINSSQVYLDDTAGDNFPNIRARMSNGWIRATNFNIQYMYAQAYFFARALHLLENQEVAVGFYQAAFVNTNIGQWLDPLSIAENPDITPISNLGYRYDLHVRPAMGYTFRGMIWDQGENDASPSAISAQYGRWLRSLITNWRSLSGNPSLLTIVTQLPTIRDEWRSPQTGPVATGNSDRNTRIRHAQFEAQALPGVYVIPGWDISDGDIHPRIAREKAQRASRVYQNVVMNRTDVIPLGPTFHRQEILGNQLVLQFRNVGTGLALNPAVPATLQAGANPATDLLGMAIAGSNGVFHWANAVIGFDTVTLSSPNVAAPTQARYTWADDLRQLGNLVNSAGLTTPTFNSILNVEIASSPEQPPMTPALLAAISASAGQASFSISLSAIVSGSISDPETNTPVTPTYLWNLGDGQTSTAPALVHTYASEGTYLVTLTVTDGFRSTQVQRSVQAIPAAPVVPETPLTFAAATTVTATPLTHINNPIDLELASFPNNTATPLVTYQQTNGISISGTVTRTDLTSGNLLGLSAFDSLLANAQINGVTSGVIQFNLGTANGTTGTNNGTVFRGTNGTGTLTVSSNTSLATAYQQREFTSPGDAVGTGNTNSIGIYGFDHPLTPPPNATFSSRTGYLNLNQTTLSFDAPLLAIGFTQLQRDASRTYIWTVTLVNRANLSDTRSVEIGRLSFSGMSVAASSGGSNAQNYRYDTFVGYQAPVGFAITALRWSGGSFGNIDGLAYVAVPASPPALTFTSWNASYGLSSSFGDDSDGDGLPDGLEFLLGTHPGNPTPAILNLFKTGNGFSFTHPLNESPISGATLLYEWSSDLSEWRRSGETNAAGTTVTMNPSAPTDGRVTVTVQVSAGPADRIFSRLVAQISN
jgi:sialate O-acetylesterase